MLGAALCWVLGEVGGGAEVAGAVWGKPAVFERVLLLLAGLIVG